MRSVFLFWPGPRLVAGLTQFAMNFVGVAVGPQGVDVRVGGFDFQDSFTGEISGEPSLPELVFALDFAFGLGRRGVAQTDVVELKSPAQLGQRVRVMGEKEAVIIDIELQRPSVSQKGGGQEVEVGEQEFAFVEFGTGKQTAAIIEHVEHGPGEWGMGEPAVGRGIQLPEFANAVALPAAHWSPDFLGRDRMGQMVGQSPAADLGAVELEVVQAQSFRGHKAVRTRWRAVEPFVEKIQNRLGPGGGVVAAGVAGNPAADCCLGASAKVSRGESIKAAAGDAELIGCLGGPQGALGKGFEHIADKRRCMTTDELLIIFRAGRIPRRRTPAASLFVGHRYARPPQRLAAGVEVVLLC